MRTWIATQSVDLTCAHTWTCLCKRTSASCVLRLLAARLLSWPGFRFLLPAMTKRKPDQAVATPQAKKLPKIEPSCSTKVAKVAKPASTKKAGSSAAAAATVHKPAPDADQVRKDYNTTHVYVCICMCPRTRICTCLRVYMVGVVWRGIRSTYDRYGMHGINMCVYAGIIVCMYACMHYVRVCLYGCMCMYVCMQGGRACGRSG